MLARPARGMREGMGFASLSVGLLLSGRAVHFPRAADVDGWSKPAQYTRLMEPKP